MADPVVEYGLSRVIAALENRGLRPTRDGTTIRLGGGETILGGINTALGPSESLAVRRVEDGTATTLATNTVVSGRNTSVSNGVACRIRMHSLNTIASTSTLLAVNIDRGGVTQLKVALHMATTVV